MKYKLWIDGWNDEESAREIEAPDEEMAVERYVERVHGDLDYPGEVEVHVIHDDGTKCGWVVTVETSPTFSARRI